MYKFTIKFVFDDIPIFQTFSRMSIYWIKAFSFFCQKINMSILIKISFIYKHLSREYAKKSIFFRIFVNSEIFKILFTKRKLIRYYYFINIYIIYWNRAFVLKKFVFFNFSVIKFYNFLSIFIYGFKFF